jgi:hypothetical protein
MAAYTVAAGAIGVHAKTLAANTVDTVTFTDDVDWVEIISDGAAAVYVTVDGSTPTVAGGGTWEMPAGVQSVLTLPSPQPFATRAESVALISAGAAKYGVRAASAKHQLGLRVGGAGSSSGSPVLVETSTASKGYAQGTSTGTAQLLSAIVTIPAGATKVLLVPSAAIRLRDDGSALRRQARREH